MKTVTINWQPQDLEDDIVKLAPLAKSDFEKMFEVASDPLIWEQHPTKNRYKREVFQLYFDGAISSKSAFVIVDKTSEKIIGCTRYYDFRPDNSSIAIGYTFLSRHYWGGLYNKSSKMLLLDYAFQFVNKIYFHIGATNLRSQLATMKIGAIKIGEVNINHYGEDQLHYEYLIQKQ
jgi:RimJ/RimL family protein N-acetyltransferase